MLGKKAHGGRKEGCGMGEMSKSPEEIKNFETKKELAYVALGKVSYEGCHKIAAKALAYIQQLESNDSQVQKALKDNGFQTLEELLKAYSQVKRERDAAVSDIKKSCVTCRYYEVTHNGYDCNYKGACDNIYSAWEWRGVPEPTEECNDEKR